MFAFDYEDHMRRTYYKSDFLYIESVSVTKKGTRKNEIETRYSGYVGIMPWTSFPAKKEENFLWKLKNDGIIDHMTVAFYISND